jgi:membrane-associated protease RseP (regulator of RpoE activity)
VLLTVSGEPVQDEATLRERIGASGGETVSVVLLRGGKRLSVAMTPRPREWEWEIVTFAMGNQYRIGVRVAEVDESLRSQLGLPEDLGLVATEIIEESPAAQAGIELHDILLEFGGKPLRTTEDLTTQVQEVGDRAATMELVRKGEQQSVRVTPEHEQPLIKVNFVESVNFTPIDVLLPTIDGVVESVVEPSPDEAATSQLQQLIREMEALTERMEALQRSLRAPADE